MSYVLENKKKLWKFNGVEVVSIITRCWSFGLRKNITVLEIPRNRVHLSVTSERVGGWGGHMCSRVARSIPGENKHSSLTLLTALLTHEICFSLPFFFTINVKKKIIFILTVSQCKFTVINATQISKFEREGSSSKKSTATPRIFSFSLRFPHKS